MWRCDAPVVGEGRVQVLGHRQLRQLRRRQGDQALCELQHVQRVAPLLAAAGAEEFTGFFVSAAHAVRHSDHVARIVHFPHPSPPPSPLPMTASLAWTNPTPSPRACSSAVPPHVRHSLTFISPKSAPPTPQSPWPTSYPSLPP